jgi:CheY-like chemotaxis protein
MKPVLTTGDVAKYCHVTIPTVCSWIKKGHLASYTLPTGHHRILPGEFRAFLNRNGMPINERYFSDQEAQARILIVDDEPQVADVIKEMLARDEARFSVASTSDPFEAGMLVASFRPHLVVLDLMMPGVDGFQVCQRIRRDPEATHTRILIVTGFSEAENIEKALALGADGLMEKPLDTDEFLAAVDEILSQGDRQSTPE